MTRVLLGVVVSAGLFPAAGAAETVGNYRDVKLTFKAHCFSCHAALKQEAGLRLDTGASIRTGGDSGQAVIPGNARGSLLIERITSADASYRMPPEGDALAASQIDRIRAWIKQGAPSPPDEAPEEDPREHWAFKTPVRPVPPEVKNAGWLDNPIDAFIAAEHERQGLVPLPSATKPILLRRISLDLIGLPPTVAEQRDFLVDDSPEAYERVVDRLLASHLYGERWGRHWMDVWRYSDWYGRRQVNDVRNSYPHVWRWRDWIVDSLNQDQGYDEMVRQMLAADELYPTDDERIVALGFIVRNWFSLNYDTWKQSLVEHTGKAFLGLRFNCAHCHNHKYDPISQEEYFRFRAFFEPLEFRHDRVPNGPALTKYLRFNPKTSGPLRPIMAGLARVYDHSFSEKTYMYRFGDTRDRMARPPVAPGVPAILGGHLAIESMELPPVAWYPGLKRFAQAAAIAEHENAVKVAQTAVADVPQGRARGDGSGKAATSDGGPQPSLAVCEATLYSAKAALTAIRAQVTADNARYRDQQRAELPRSRLEELAGIAGQAQRQAALAAAERQLVVAQERLAQARSQSDQKTVKTAEDQTKSAREAVETARKTRRETNASYTPLGPIYPQRSTGRRRALADWIASRENPLTARVAVNHIWGRHFDRPLVGTVFDFGRGGKKPTHPPLLDWLAVELMTPTADVGGTRPEQRAGRRGRLGWGMKHIHRLIVTSKTYRLSSRPGGSDHPNFGIDKDNVYRWKFDRRRLEAELVRDSVLYVADGLELALGGPEIDPGEESASRRRSLYFAVYPEAGGMMKFLSLFDPPNPQDCYRRSESTVPQQALAMSNSQLALDQGRKLAAILSPVAAAGRQATEGERDDLFVRTAFERILCRAPTRKEGKECRDFLQDQRVLYDSTSADRLRAAPGTGYVTAASAPEQRARESLVRVLLNHNDFFTIH